MTGVDDDLSVVGCLASLMSLLLGVLLFWSFLSTFDYVTTSDRAASACKSGVAKRSTHWSVTDAVYFRVTCTDGRTVRVN